MTDYISPELAKALRNARADAMRTSRRLKVAVGEAQYPLLRPWGGGFSLDIADAPKLRGMVDVYDGAKHLMHCLIIAAEEDSGTMLYEFKRAQEVHDSPPLDYARDENAPIALIAQAPAPH